MRDFVVYTFCQPGETRVSKVQCYTRWCPGHWKGYMKLTVLAESGKEAKRIAAKERVRIEREALAAVEGGGDNG